MVAGVIPAYRQCHGDETHCQPMLNTLAELLRPATLHSQTGHFLPCLLWVSVRWSVSALLALLSGAGLLTSDLWEVAPALSPPLPQLLVGAGRCPGAAKIIA